MFTRDCGRSLTTKIGSAGRTLCRSGRVGNAPTAWQLFRNSRKWRHCGMAERPPTKAEFEDWAHPCDVIEYYHQQREPDPRSFATAMLCDGTLRAAAGQFILNGRDHGLAIIPAQIWTWAAGTEVWSNGWFQLAHVGKDAIIRVSAYDVRIDRQIRALPPPERDRIAGTGAPALSDTDLQKWAELFFSANPGASEQAARRALAATFPAKFVSRERLRRIMPARRRGRPLKDKG